MSVHVYEKITQSIVEALERGVVPWRRPWTVTAAPPANLLTRRPYRGINAVVTWFAGFASPYWLTWLQTQELGGRIRKGEHGTPIMFFRLRDEASEAALEGEDDIGDDDERRRPSRRRAIIRYTHVWNVAQVEGLNVVAPSTDAPPLPPDERAENVLNGWLTAPATMHGYRRASYNPREDMIRMPPKASFSTAGGYYGTRFHEATHATGHPSRLARFDLDAPLPAFGSEDYSKEELVAELGAAFLCGAVGLGVEAEVEASASYVATWLNVLKDDRRFLVRAASQAQCAADLILERAADARESASRSSEPCAELA